MQFSDKFTEHFDFTAQDPADLVMDIEQLSGWTQTATAIRKVVYVPQSHSYWEKVALFSLFSSILGQGVHFTPSFLQGAKGGTCSFPSHFLASPQPTEVGWDGRWGPTQGHPEGFGAEQGLEPKSPI